MKLKFILIGALLFSVLLLSNSAVVAQDEHHEEGEEQCSNPTQTVEIVADPDADGSLKYDKTEINLDRNACVKIIFKNKAVVTAHDFTTDAVTDDGFEGIHVHMENNTDGHEGSDTKEFHLQTPDLDVTYKFYCSVLGHEEAGMVGDMIIGEGSSLPGFTLSFALIPLLFLALVPIIRRKS